MTRASSVFRPPQPDDGRQRDVFPLPLLQIEGEIAKKSMARSVQKRIERRRATQRRVNMAIAALNSMFHGGRYRGEPTYCSNLRSVPEVQRYVLNHIITRVKRCGGRPADASYSGAIDALRVSCGSYQDDTVGVGDTVCMELEILSLPCLSDSGVNLEGELNGDAGRALRHFEDEMLQDAPSWGRLGNEVSKVKPYNDPQLRHRGFYLKFLKRLQSCGILTFCARPRGRVGAFTVSKKPKFVDGVEKRRQRLILDCRQVNLQFRAPPLTELGSLASLCEAELHNNDILYTGGADIQDCFYACFMPKELTEFFCLSWDLSLEEAIAVGDGELPEALHGCNPEFRVAPCLRVLPMGFSWSFYLVQQLHEQITLSSLRVGRDSLFLDARPAPPITGERCAAMPYCDNVHVMGVNDVVTEEGRQTVCRDLRHKGFKVHEEQPATSIIQTLGGVIDGLSGEVRVTEKKMWNLILAFEYLATTRKPMSSDLVRRLLGHAMFVCVISRPGMSIFRSLYDFAARGYVRHQLWDSSRRECLTFAGIIPLLYGNIRRPWSTRVTCTDASPDGFGVVSSGCLCLNGGRAIEPLGSVWSPTWQPPGGRNL